MRWLLCCVSLAKPDLRLGNPFPVLRGVRVGREKFLGGLESESEVTLCPLGRRASVLVPSHLLLAVPDLLTHLLPGCTSGEFCSSSRLLQISFSSVESRCRCAWRRPLTCLRATAIIKVSLRGCKKQRCILAHPWGVPAPASCPPRQAPPSFSAACPAGFRRLRQTQ